MKAKELSKQNKEELDKKLVELRKELMKENSQLATGTAPKNSGKLRNTKKTIARILTIMNTKSNSKNKTKEE